MNLRRSSAVIVAAALCGVGQFGLATAAHAASGVSGLTFDGPDEATPVPWTSTLPPGSDAGFSFQIENKKDPAVPVDAHVLVFYTASMPRFDGTDKPIAPKGLSVRPSASTHDCIALAAPDMYMCNMTKANLGYALFSGKITSAAPDLTGFYRNLVIVPSSDTTFAQVNKQLAAGAKYPHDVASTIVEYPSTAAKDRVSTSLHDAEAGTTFTEHVKVTSADYGSVDLVTKSPKNGFVWNNPQPGPGISGGKSLLPTGLDLTAVEGNGGASCWVSKDQHDDNGVEAPDYPETASCQLTPKTTSLTLTFTAKSNLPTWKVELQADYRVIGNTMKPQTSAHGVFTVRRQAAANSSPSASSAPSASASAAVPGASASAGGNQPAPQLANTGSGDLAPLAGGAGAVVVAGAALTFVGLRRKRRA